MKILRLILIIACCIGVVYGYWGAFTRSGNQYYEGMTALLPFYILLTSAGLLLIIGIYFLLLAIVKKGKR